MHWFVCVKNADFEMCNRTEIYDEGFNSSMVHNGSLDFTADTPGYNTSLCSDASSEAKGIRHGI